MIEMIWPPSFVSPRPKKAVVAKVQSYGVEVELKFDSVDEFRFWWRTSDPAVRLMKVELHGKPVLASELLLIRLDDEVEEAEA